MPEQRARARMYADGSAVVQTATQEFGTGVLDDGDAGRRRRPRRRARRDAFQAGDTDLPNSTAAVGSAGAGMVSVRRARRRRPRCATSSSRWRSATTGSPLHGADRELGDVARRPDGAPRERPGRRRDLRRAAAAQPHGRRRGDGQLAAAAARHAARAARRSAPSSPRSPSTPSSGWCGCGGCVGRVRAGAGAQPEARPQPADGRHALGPGPGAAGGQPHGPAHGPLGARATSPSTWSRSTPTRRT